MQSTLFDQQLKQFFAQLPVDSLVLTPNKRLSRFVQGRYAHYQQTERGQGAFTSLNCLSLAGWLQQCWQQLLFHQAADHGVLLDTLQESLLWEQVIEEHEQTPALLNIAATARLAQDAWRLIHEWHLATDSPGVPVFKAWARAFQQRCSEHGFQPLAGAGEKIRQAIRANIITQPTALWLYGFDEYTPALKGLLLALKEKGCSINKLSLTSDTELKQRFEFRDEEQEIRAAANWALQCWHNNPEQSIAIVSPRLASQRQLINRIFTRVFDKAYIFPDTHQHAPGYNISAGQPLAQVPIISASLDILKSYRSKQDLYQLSALLRCCFVGLQAELADRALLDIKLRELGELQISLQDVKTLCSEMRNDDESFVCEDFYQRLNNFDQSLKKNQGPYYPSEWAPRFMQWLDTMGWPGDRTLDSIEYQQVQSWQGCLEKFSTLDFVLGKISINNAVSSFEKCCQQHSFQAQTQSSPIQVLGILEAAGLPFDKLWLLNMDHDNWPPAPQLNPLLPAKLQIDNKLPQSSAERELQYAGRLTQRFLHSAGHIIFSNALVREDRQLSASSLISHQCTQATQIPPAWLTHKELEETLFSHQRIEASLDNVGPQVSDTGRIRGGSQILKHQSACPFQAFARHRLHSTDIPQLEIGLNAMERGNLVHDIMEMLWRRLKNQNKLIAMDEQALFKMIDHAIGQALQSIKRKRFVGTRFIQLESRRLRQQIRAWMELEKERSPFTVLFNEGRKTVKLAKMPIHIRYDRVDKLEDGSLFVLDYKTGRTDIRDWSGERPNEPQVPLYVIANHKRVSGAAFGQISADEVQYKGIAENSSIAPKLIEPEMLFKMDLPGNWQDILRHWRAVLEQLAKDFMAGSAAVAPKQANITCRYCELKPLCRIRERFNLEQQDDSQSEGEEQ